MQIDITGRHVEITEAMRNYVSEKFQRIERHFDQLVDIHVILSVEKLVQKAEATIQVSGAKLYAEDEQTDMYAAIDSLADKLDRMTIKHKEKQENH